MVFYLKSTLHHKVKKQFFTIEKTLQIFFGDIWSRELTP